jgi:O-antigen ligase
LTAFPRLAAYTRHYNDPFRLLVTPRLILKLPSLRAAPLARALPAALVLLFALRLAWTGRGSIDASNWLSTAVLASLVLAVVLASGASRAPNRLLLVGAASLVALAVWDFASLTWSAVPQLARDEALLALMYALALLVPAVSLAGRADRQALAAAVALALGATAVASGIHVWSAGDPLASYWDGRLAFPVSYPNANAALFLLGFWPAVALAARAAAPVALRAAGLGAATGMLAAWLAAQSKGGAIGLAASAVVFFAICPARLRALVPTLLAGAIALVAWAPLTAPFRASEADAVAAMHRTGIAIVLVTLAGIALGAGYALVDARVSVSESTHRVLGSIALTALVAAGAGAIAIFFVRVDHPRAFVERQWNTLKTQPGQEHTSSTHLLTFGSNRPDFWRVALHEFERRPITGVGARGFGPAYLTERRSNETPQRAHSLELDALGETGLVGFLLLAGGLGAPIVLLARRARTSAEATALLAAATYFVVHASVDWIWTFASVGLVLMLLLGIGGADGERPVPARAALGGAAAALAVALLAFAPPWLSIRFTNHALAAHDVAALSWSRRLDPLSVDPYLAESLLAGPGQNIAPLRRAVDKQPRRAELHFRLGLALLDARRKQEARTELRHALRLDPFDDVVRAALLRARG